MQIWYKPFFHLDLNIFLGILLLFDFAICMISGDASFDSSNTISDRYLTVKFGSSCIRFTRFYRSTTGGMILNPNDSGRVAGALQTRSARPVDSPTRYTPQWDGSPPRQRVDRKKRKKGPWVGLCRSGVDCLDLMGSTRSAYSRSRRVALEDQACASPFTSRFSGNAMSKFYTATCQAKELAEEVKTTKEKAKELCNEVLLKKGEVIRLTDEVNRLLASETKLKEEVEELKADGVEKDTRVAYLEEEVSGFTSSLEKAREEVISAFKKSDEYKNRLDSHYAAGYENFRADAKEAYPDLNFDSFKLPLATESSLLQTSSEDVNIMDDANTKVTQDEPK